MLKTTYELFVESKGWVSVFFPAVAALVGGWAGAKYGLNKFKKEKFWEEQRQVYGKVLDTVENLEYWGSSRNRSGHADNIIGDNIRNYDFSSDEGIRQLIKIKSVHKIYFSKSFLDVIEKYLDEIYTQDSICRDSSLGAAIAEKQLNATNLAGEIARISKQYLEKLNEIALKDIGLSKR